MERKIVVAALDALSQETRLEVFRLLVQAGDDGMSAGSIGEKLNVPNATLSFHLQQLKHAGLATTQRKSTTIIYKANYETMNGVIGYLSENCCQGASDQCQPAESCCLPETVEPTKEST